MPGIYFGNMNDKIKQLLATAEKVDIMRKIKWRIENRELLRKQRKLELKILMEKDKLTSVEWLINEHFGGIENCTPDFRRKIEKAISIEKERLEESYQDGREIGTIETLLKNKEHK